MKKNTPTSAQIYFNIIAIIPFSTAVLLLITGLITLNDISLLPPFSINFNAVFIFSLVHLAVIVLLKKWKKTDIGLIKLTLLKKVTVIFLLIVILFLSNLLLVISLKMNFNYWLRSNSVEKIEISVENKYISHGRGTDYYVEFGSEKGKLTCKVSRRNYDSFNIGDSFEASVNRGYFEGYFLTEKLKITL